ncbi:hypothetical protein K504DRAFT_259903 [Pleomassaria siparia CBS 279.74]|uniref:Uncharacterized protein n=1 Tax=Pleomassaria siparia CBS 279.74 TaxID=1314801 RepID=A0A6G1KC48_9PLEO|nr:hypothetical protein K504DRAFT_259903 [Pleomassaria siparia CBS 279.74]
MGRFREGFVVCPIPACVASMPCHFLFSRPCLQPSVSSHLSVSICRLRAPMAFGLFFGVVLPCLFIISRVLSANCSPDVFPHLLLVYLSPFPSPLLSYSCHCRIPCAGADGARILSDVSPTFLSLCRSITFPAHCFSSISCSPFFHSTLCRHTFTSTSPLG